MDSSKLHTHIYKKRLFRDFHSFAYKLVDLSIVVRTLYIDLMQPLKLIVTVL